MSADAATLLDVRLTVRVRPGASRNEVGGRYASGEPPTLLAKVAAPAKEGRANAALIEVLAEELALPKSAIRIVAGAKSKTKVVEIAGADPALVERLLHRA
jgi:uncharacterized protein (TIGR00251 family)